MFEDKAGKYLIERLFLKRKAENIGGQEFSVGMSLYENSLPCRIHGTGRYIDRHNRRTGAPSGKEERLGSGAAPDLKHTAPLGVVRVIVQEICKCIRLIIKP